MYLKDVALVLAKTYFDYKKGDNCLYQTDCL